MTFDPPGVMVPLNRLAPVFACGILLFQALPQLPPPWLLAALPGVLMLGAWHRTGYRWLLPLLAGVLWAWGHAAWQLSQRLDPALEGRDLVLQGTVTGLPHDDGRRSRFLFRPDSPGGEGATTAVSGTLRLNWYRERPPLVSGERWRLTVRLKAPHGFANPGGFDYEGWLFREGIRATGYVRNSPDNRRLAPARLTLDRIRQDLRDRLAGALQGSAATGLVLALSIGDRDRLDPRQWEVLTRTGTNHLVAISGLHVGILAGLGFFLLRRLWAAAPPLTRLMAADRAAAAGALGVAVAYAGLAGFAVSTQRALVMLAVVFVAILLRRSLRPSTGLSLALAGVLLLDPPAALSPGFWLSFSAVAVLLYGMSRRTGRGGLGWRWGRAQWLVAVGLAPLLFLLFGTASLIAPLVNLLAVPLVSLILLPWVLIASALVPLTGWTLPLQGAAGALEAGFAGLQWLAQPDWAAWSMAARPAWAWSLALIGVALLLAPRGLPGRWTGLPLLLPMVLYRAEPLPEGGFRFTLLDVGQGLAAVVQTRSHLLVYDTGPRFRSGFNTGTTVVAPFLRARGLARIDTLVVSHGDIDHAGGVSGLLSRIPVGRILAGNPSPLRARQAEQCRSGQRWHWDGVDFQVLHPGAEVPAEDNNRSCVLRVSGAGGSVLLTGDAEIAVERTLVSRHGDGLRSNVLVAGHHGSDTSSSAELLARVRPDWVLFSAGYRNRYGFPRPEVVRRVRRAGARTADTINGGALDMRLLPDAPTRAPIAHRERHAHYWHHRAPVLGAADSGYDAGPGGDP